ncbi:MAG: agmatine deiminase family protein [Pseudomonadota bacterium]
MAHGAAMEVDPISIPPEWGPHAAIWVGWPHLRGEWGDAFDGAREEIAGFIRALCQTTPVRVACGSREAYGSACLALETERTAGRVSLHTLPAGDIWVRDTGPIFAGPPRRLALQFTFNGWGGKFVMPGDTLTAGAIASVEQVPLRRQDFVLEGGAVDLDGAGRLLTTRQCVLNANRNPGWTETAASAALKQAFQVHEVIWLDDGLLNDHTDGHIDNIARFIGPGRVICQSPSGSDDPNAALYCEIEATLRAAHLEVVTLPSPGRVTDLDEASLPASHVNFLISNGAVYLPVYEDVYAPKAVQALEAALPDHKIIALPARHILAGGGAFHCMTQQVPDDEEADK